MFSKTFKFGNEIKSADYFDESKGFGFVDLAKVEGETNSKKGLRGGNWNLRGSAVEEYKEAFYDANTGVYVKRARNTLVFKVAVPEFGSYKITIKTVADEAVKDMCFWAGRRNLLKREISLKVGETFKEEFFTFVSPYIPALTSVADQEKAVYVCVNGENAGFSEITIEQVSVPTIFIAGDSTLTDQGALTPFYRIASCCGWAQLISAYMKDMSVCNQAHSGLTSNCFKDDGHLGCIDNLIKPGDMVFIQFGHNDQKRRNLQAFGGYLNNLRWYVKWVREKGAVPVIVSPISRIPFEDDFADLGGGRKQMCSLLKTHALACKTASEELGVAFIDLHQLTFDRWCQLGIENCRDYFCKGDITHTNDYGASLLAGFVIDEIKRQKIEPAYSHLKDVSYSQLLPDSDVKEAPVEVPQGGMFDIEPPYVDIKGIPEYEGIKAAFKKALLDPCVMYLHPYDFMPRAQFFMVYFKALRMAGKRPYTGKYVDIARYEWDSSYIEAAIDENLIDEATISNAHFRPDEPMNFEELSSLLIRGLKEKKEERNLPLNRCFSDAKGLGLIKNDAKEKEAINRAECYIALSKLCDLLDTGNKALPSDAEIHPVG